MATLFNPQTIDTAGQVAIVQGIDSNVFQGRDAAGAIVRHPAAFTSLEASFGAHGRGRTSGTTVRAFGRYVEYEPLSGDFGRRTARGGLLYRNSHRIDRLTTFATSLLGTVGSLQAERGTDGLLTIDPVSTRRTVWGSGATGSFILEISERSTLTVLSSVDAGGTLTESPTSQRATVRHGRGLDFVSASARLSLAHRRDRLTTVGGALIVQRTHLAYTLQGGDPSGPSLRSIDGAAAAVTSSVARVLSEATAVNGTLGVTFAIPELGERARAVPLADAGLVHSARSWSAWAIASFRYWPADPRVGPGVASSVSLVFLGKPLTGGSHDLLDVVAQATGQRTVIIAGVNDGSSVVTGSASITTRWRLGGSFGLLAGYDVRAVRFASAGDAADSSYVRHLGFIGLAYGWVGSGAVTPNSTLITPPAM